MNTQQKRTIKDIQTDFVQLFNLYIKYMYSSKDNIKEEEIQKISKLSTVGMELLLVAADSCHFKDSFEAFYCPDHILMVEIKSIKNNTSYNLGYDWFYHKLYFQSYIENPQYIKNLQDDFILDFFSACKKYGFKYKDDNNGTSGKSIFHASIKSDIFRLFRNYTSDVLSEEGFDVYNNKFLGFFEKEWDFKEITSIQEIYDELCIAIKYFYKFNYHLWKAKTTEEKKHKDHK